jgi:phytoene dehydrogenase-like protein
MNGNGRKVVIIGGGIAGLCAGVYAQKCGYQAEVLEMHDIAGGLATSWRRHGYTFETCLHWFVGSKPGGDMHPQWEEVFDIEELQFIDPVEFMRIESEDGETLRIPTNVDQLEVELLRRAPQDEVEIKRLTNAIRSLSKFKIPDPGRNWMGNLGTYVHDLPYLPLFFEFSKLTGKEYANRFSDRLIRSFFAGGEMGQMSAIALVFSLAWMNAGNAGYSIGGSQAIIRLIQKKLVELGGEIRFGAKVSRIVVQDRSAAGVELESGEFVAADWVISAADGHSTIFELLEGRYADEQTRAQYDTMPIFPSYLQVSFGVAMDLKQQPPMLNLLLDSPFWIDPGTEVPNVSFRFFHFDPTFAPAGKTAVTCFLPTRNAEYWTALDVRDPITYRTEKNRVAEAVIKILERRIPGICRAIEAVDISTPATVIRFTGNWKGSMEGWLPTPSTGFKAIRNTLPGLERFLMVGQWVLPGGGLPSGMLTARPAVQAICKQDGVPFTVREQLTSA